MDPRYDHEEIVFRKHKEEYKTFILTVIHYFESEVIY